MVIRLTQVLSDDFSGTTACAMGVCLGPYLLPYLLPRFRAQVADTLDSGRIRQGATGPRMFSVAAMVSCSTRSLSKED
jgi:hypothetical protein